ARVAERPVRKADLEPTVAIIVAAYNEAASIGRRIENLLALDSPQDKLEIVDSSDASDDGTDEIAVQYPRVKVVPNPKGGKVAAQDRAVRQTSSDVVAFSDANCTWAPDALRKLVRSFADPDVAYVCGQLKILRADGSNKEGVYWRYELGVREAESRLGSITGGNGSIYDPEAHAFEKPTPTNVTEYRRKVRMFEHCWLIVLRGKMLRRLGVTYGLEIVSHRLLRYGSGILHVVLLATSIALLGSGWIYDVALGLQLGLVGAALAGVGIARYYVLVTWATLVALVNYVRRGVPANWEPVRE